jgi:hypothetical protein
VRLPEDARLALIKAPEDRDENDQRLILQAYGQFDPDTRSLYEKITAHKKSVPTEPQTQAQTIVAHDEPRETHIQIRGDFLQPGDLVNPGTPAVFPPLHPRGETPDRLDLAHWLVAPENPLTARVQVNRTWARLFGDGLVRTAEDLARPHLYA